MCRTFAVAEEPGPIAAAARMLAKQLSETDAPSRVALCQDIITFCDQLEATTLPALMYRSAYTRVSVIGYAPESSVDQIAKCQAAVAQLPALAGLLSTDWMTFAPKIAARLQIYGLK
jgi:hypothetical protein